MEQIRTPAVAGMFYPANPSELRQMLSGFLADAATEDVRRPKAIIVPHAGYIYSGPVAASAYAHLAPLRDTVKRVVLLGPSHRVAFRGLAVCHADIFETPLGNIPVDKKAIEEIIDLPQVTMLDNAHAQEHSLEVHLPFLQMTLSEFSLVPLVVGDAVAQDVADVINTLWGDEDTLIVVSSDLSHYHDYETARTLDKNTCHAIEKMQPEAIGYDQACGRNPVNGLLLAAKQHGLHTTTLDLRNSGDTAGPRNQVVGYGAWMLL